MDSPVKLQSKNGGEAEHRQYGQEFAAGQLLTATTMTQSWCNFCPDSLHGDTESAYFSGKTTQQTLRL